MAMIQINCTRCNGTGLIGTVAAAVCPDCLGTGLLTENDQSTIATLNNTLVTPIEENAPKDETVLIANEQSFNNAENQ